MDIRKVRVFIGAVAVIAALLIAYYARISTAQQRGPGANADRPVKAESLPSAAEKDSTKMNSGR